MNSSEKCHCPLDNADMKDRGSARSIREGCLTMQTQCMNDTEVSWPMSTNDHNARLHSQCRSPEIKAASCTGDEANKLQVKHLCAESWATDAPCRAYRMQDEHFLVLWGP
jgi:hypothetical protein